MHTEPYEFQFEIKPNASSKAEVRARLIEILQPVFGGLYPKASLRLVQMLAMQAADHAMNNVLTQTQEELK